MGKFLKKFNSHSDYLAFTQTSDFIKPNVSHCVQENDVHYNPWTWAEEYLTFVALTDSSFKLTRNAVSYSLDNGETWTELSASTNTPIVTAGNKIMWKGEIVPSSTNPSEGIGVFGSTGDFDVQGNIMSLLYGDNYKGQTDLTGKQFAFYSLFYNNRHIINSENLVLPATTLDNYCYKNMFQDCTNLVTAPFVLPATTLKYDCYDCMFDYCTKLTTPPKILATTLAIQSCKCMFRSCTSLVNAPELPAETLASSCYSEMFSGCTSLNYIKAMFTTTPGSTYTSNWVNGVSATGTFVKNSAAQWDVSGVNGVPTGWTVQTASE